MPTPELQEFLAKIQGGDEGAVEAMLQELDPFLRRVIHLRLLDGRLRRAVDTTDIRMRVNRAVAAVLTEPGDKG